MRAGTELHWQTLCDDSGGFWLDPEQPDLGVIGLDQDAVSKLAGVDSPIELRLLLALRGFGIDPHPQVSVGRYRVDFLVGMLVIECDGHEFHASKEQRTHDAGRDRWLMSQGYRVVRFTGSEIFRDAVKCAQEVRDLVHPFDRRERT